jgi:hypothetical protein
MHGACQKKSFSFQPVAERRAPRGARQARPNQPWVRQFLPCRAAALPGPLTGKAAPPVRSPSWDRRPGFHEMLTITFIQSRSAVGPEGGPLG